MTAWREIGFMDGTYARNYMFDVGVSLQTIIDYGVARSFGDAQILEDAKYYGYTIDSSIVTRAREEFREAMMRFFHEHR